MSKKKIIWLLFVLLACWITIDVSYPFKTDITKINAVETATLESGMWRSYYEKKPVKLFMQSAQLLRSMFHVPFWRSYVISYYSAKAAFIFKEGHNRDDYEKALPFIQTYYRHIDDISKISFNVDSAARSELEWWIIRRYRQEHSPAEWEKYISETSSIVYHFPVKGFKEYAHLRVEAMLLRDGKDTAITEKDWQQITHLLTSAWQSFAQTIQNN